MRYGQLYTKYRGFIFTPKSFIQSSHASQYTAIYYGDVLFAASGEKVDEIGKSAVNLMRTAAVCGGDVIILRPRIDICPPFLGYALDCYSSASQKASMCRGSTIKHIYPDELRRLAVSLPPLDEQAAIVRFLDHANRKIDGFVRAKRKLIGLLNEQKQAIIHRAVTRGLNPDVPLKPAGVPWLESVPNHWQMTPNRSLFRIRKVLVGPRHREYQVLSLTKRGVIVRDMEAGGKFSNFWERSQEVRPGDLVFCFFDVDETPRAIGLSHALGMISPDYTVMECSDTLVASFLECFYVAMDDRKMLRPLYTGLRKRISKPLFLAAKTPIPPPEELSAILAFVKGAVIEIDSSLEVIQREIALMQEYRTRLTADIVTGKLDVREAAAKLPDLPAEAAAESSADDAMDDTETEELEA